MILATNRLREMRVSVTNSPAANIEKIARIIGKESVIDNTWDVFTVKEKCAAG
jgi:hypothetical protein